MEPGPNRAPRSRAWPWLGWVLWALAGALVAYAVFGPSGARELRELRAERQRLESRIAELEADNRRLQTQIDRLRSEPGYLERLARERLGMVKPNERVVVVPKDQP